MIVLTPEGTFDDRGDLGAVRGLALRFPGGETIRVTVAGRSLDLGPAWRVSQCTGLLLALSEFGSVEVIEA
jgi:hypothetical protein